MCLKFCILPFQKFYRVCKIWALFINIHFWCLFIIFLICNFRKFWRLKLHFCIKPFYQVFLKSLTLCTLLGFIVAINLWEICFLHLTKSRSCYWTDRGLLQSIKLNIRYWISLPVNIEITDKRVIFNHRCIILWYIWPISIIRSILSYERKLITQPKFLKLFL